jgi:hypothetical protein
MMLNSGVWAEIGGDKTSDAIKDISIKVKDMVVISPLLDGPSLLLIIISPSLYIWLRFYISPKS